MKKFLVTSIIIIVLISIFSNNVNADDITSNGKPFQEIWNAIANLQSKIDNIKLIPGPQGEQGETGPQGIQGEIGETGLHGESGQDGQSGEQGLRGDQGEPGDPGWNQEYINYLEERIDYLESLHPSEEKFIFEGAYFKRSFNQHLFIYSDNQIGLNPSGNMTIEVWVKLNSSPSNTDYSIISRDEPVPNRGWRFIYRDTNGVKALRFGVSSNSNANSSDSPIYYTLEVDVWTHLAVIYNSSMGSWKLYVNGSFEGIANGIEIGQDSSSATIKIGSTWNPAASFFDGYMDDVRIWDGIRTDLEISDNYLMELVGDENNLKGYWKFNSNFLDSSLNANHLSNNNGVTIVKD